MSTPRIVIISCDDGSLSVWSDIPVRVLAIDAGSMRDFHDEDVVEGFAQSAIEWMRECDVTQPNFVEVSPTLPDGWKDTTPGQ